MSKWTYTAAVAAVVLLAGCTTEVPGPTITVTAPATPMPTITVTPEPAIPAACLQALTQADVVIAASGRAMGHAGDAFSDLAEGRIGSLDKHAAGIRKETAKINASNYSELRDQCRESSR